MIATSVTYDIVFLIHVLSAIGIVVVLITMRYGALAVARGASDATQLQRFPERHNWAARLLHVVPVTGFIMVLSSGPSLARPWVGVGLVCYVAAAGHLEARTLPQERAIAQSIAKTGSATLESGRQLVRSLDVLLVIVAIALLSMVIQY